MQTSSQPINQTSLNQPYTNNSKPTGPCTRQVISNLTKGLDALEHTKHENCNPAKDRVIDNLSDVVKDALNVVQKKDLGDATRNIMGHSNSAGAGLTDRDRDVSAVSRLRCLCQFIVASPFFRSFLWEFYQLSHDSFGPQIGQVVGEQLRVQDSGYDASSKYGESDQSFAPSLPSRHASARPADEFSRMHPQQPSCADPPLPIRNTPAYPDGDYSRELSGAPSQSFGQRGFSSAPCSSKTDSTREDYPTQQSGNASFLFQRLPDSWSGSGLTGTTQSSQFQRSTDALVEQRYTETQRHVYSVRFNEEPEQLVDRWHAMFDEIKQDSHIQEAVCDMKQTFFYIKEKFALVVPEHAEGTNAAITRAQPCEGEDNLTVVLSELKGLIERFAGGKSLDPLINATNEWYIKIRKDDELCRWFEELYAYLDTAIASPNTRALEGNMKKAKLDRFVVQGQQILRGRHCDHSWRFLEEANVFIYSLVNDEATSRLRASVQNVIKDLFINAEGQFAIRPDLYNHLGKAFIPIISEKLGRIEVCRVEENSEGIDFTLANIVINDLKPDQFEVKDLTGNSAGGGADLEFRISAKGTTCKIRDAIFYYRKHTFPKLKDSGILDATLAGNGLSFDLDVSFFADATERKNVDPGDFERNRGDRSHRSIFRVKDCRVVIDKLKLKFRDANHDLLYMVFKPIIVAKAIREISRTIKEQLHHFVNELGKAAIRARDEKVSTLDRTNADSRILRGT